MHLATVYIFKFLSDEYLERLYAIPYIERNCNTFD